MFIYQTIVDGLKTSMQFFPFLAIWSVVCLIIWLDTRKVNP